MWREFVELAERREMPFTALCARFGISRKTGYKWLNRFRAKGAAGLQQLSRRPKSSPRRTPEAVVDVILAVRRARPDWTVARIRQELIRQEVSPLPAPSTIDLILRRQREAAEVRARELGPEAQKFEPNYRWAFRQGDMVELADHTKIVPVVLCDETTGFLIGATLLPHGDKEVSIEWIESLMRRHGMPWRVVLPRDESLRQAPVAAAHTPLTVWLMKLGITVEFAHGPKTAKLSEEAEARKQLAVKLSQLPAYQRAPLAERSPTPDPLVKFARDAGRLDFAAATGAFEQLREQHNFGGKQEAMQRRSPISLFRPSQRQLPEIIPNPAYAPAAEVRLVSEKGIFTFNRRLVHVGRVFAGLCVELKLTPHPDRFVVLFAGQGLGSLDISQAPIDGTASLPLGVM